MKTDLTSLFLVSGKIFTGKKTPENCPQENCLPENYPPGKLPAKKIAPGKSPPEILFYSFFVVKLFIVTSFRGVS